MYSEKNVPWNVSIIWIALHMDAEGVMTHINSVNVEFNLISIEIKERVPIVMEVYLFK